MNPKAKFREFVMSVIGLSIIGMATFAILSIFRGGILSRAPITITPILTIPAEKPTTEVPYPSPVPAYYLTPDIGATQTKVQYMIQFATEHPVTFAPPVYNTPKPTGTRESDIYQWASGKLLGLDTQNVWVGLVDGNEADVTAGALLDDPEQGAIYLVVSIPRGGVMEQILTPTKHGAVRVVSEQNNRLTLVSTDGTTYYFDVPARRFVNSLTEVVPSATPPATETPLPTPPPIGVSTPIPPTYNPYPAPTGQSTAAP
jgi:hypothetical protein